jgi:dTMP kinase
MITPQPPTTTTSTSTSIGSSIESTMPSPSSSFKPTTKRGAFVLLEGIDRCGKTTQCTKLVERLLSIGITATLMRFPDRTTSTGMIINNYLTQSQNQLDDHAIHLLFSANRWESASTLVQHLQNGTTVVCDRYVYSGVAFSASKIKAVSSLSSEVDTNTNMNSTTEEIPLLDLEWCKAPDRGLPAPDCVLFLDVSPDVAEQRGGYVYLTLLRICCLCMFCGRFILMRTYDYSRLQFLLCVYIQLTCIYIKMGW